MKNKRNKINEKKEKFVGFSLLSFSLISLSHLPQTLSRSLGPCMSYQQLGVLQVLSNIRLRRPTGMSAPLVLGAMPVKGRKKSKNREREKKVASITSVTTRSEDKKEVARVLAQSQKEQLT